MQHWFVYYKLDAAAAREIEPRLRAMQTQIAAEGGVRTRLMRRADTADGPLTLLEVYDGIGKPATFEASPRGRGSARRPARLARRAAAHRAVRGVLTDVPRRHRLARAPGLSAGAGRQPRRVLHAQHAAGVLVGQSVALLAGRDEEAGGTWLGVTRSGRLALLTNVRAPSERNPHAPSRGAIAVGALQSAQPAGEWLREQAPRMGAYNGFNLLVAEPSPTKDGAPRLLYYTNRRDHGPQALSPGVYGLSNAFLDTPWPKVVRAVSGLRLRTGQPCRCRLLLTLMADRRPVHDSELPSTGVPLDWERALAPIQIAPRLRHALDHRSDRASRRCGQFPRTQLRTRGATASPRPALRVHGGRRVDCGVAPVGGAQGRLKGSLAGLR